MCTPATSGMRDSGMEENQRGGRFEGWSALCCEKDYEGDHVLTLLAKTLTKHEV